MKKLALLLSLLALGALGLVACGGGDDEDTAAEANSDTLAEARFAEARVDRKLEAEARFFPAKLSRKQVQELERDANDWASLFVTNNCNRYMGQPICERLTCFDIEKYCTRVSAAFQRSFADATVEDIQYKGVAVVGPFHRPLYYLATVKFSNGEVVAFSEWSPGTEPPEGSCAGAGGGCVWNVASAPDQNRRFVQAAAPLE